MKNSVHTSLLLVLFSIISAIFFSSCRTTCTQTRTYIKKTPVYNSLKDIRSSFKVHDTQELENPGKIHVKGDYLFIVDWGKGFHIVDNSDKSNPLFIKFVALRGCTDVVSNNDVLYVNQGPDIVSISIQDIQSISILNRSNNVMNMHLVKEDSFVVEYTEKEVVEVIEDADCGRQSFGMRFESMDSRSESSSGGGSSSSGSMARFAVIGGFLYIVDDVNLRVFTLSDPNKPVQTNVQNLGSGVETIFAKDNHLFIGTNTGMFIFVVSNGKAQFLSQFRHARGCDPVVIDGDLAYITLRGNGACGMANDELNIVDISNIQDPILQHSFPMNEPYGLGIIENTLAICDGEAGLRIFDSSNPSTIMQNELANETGMKAFDLIMSPSHLILTAEEGIFQYNIEQPDKPILKSTLFSK
jgi:hypothetical protein